MKTMALARAIAIGVLCGLLSQFAPAQTVQRLAEIHRLSEREWTDSLDYCEWLLNAQYWIEHPEPEYAKQFLSGMKLSRADDTALRSIVADFNKRHDQLMADQYAKIDRGEWTTDDETKLVEDRVAATNDAIKLIQTKLSAEGANEVDDLVLRSRDAKSMRETGE